MIYLKSELSHHGVKGQKWGVRRYQNGNSGFAASAAKPKASNIHADGKDESGPIKKYGSVTIEKLEDNTYRVFDGDRDMVVDKAVISRARQKKRTTFTKPGRPI